MTKKYVYNVEALIKTFGEHAIIEEENRKKYIEFHKEYYPDEPIPEQYQDNFSIAKALQEICEEICRLRKGVIRHYE